MPGNTRSSGSRTPMTPVDMTSVRSRRVSNAVASASATAAWSSSPAVPVAALAHPEVTTIPSLQPLSSPSRPRRPASVRRLSARCAWLSRTGAAAKALGVKTAAAAAGRRPSGPRVVAMTERSGRPDALIPAAVAPATKPSGIAARLSTAGRTGGGAGKAGEPGRLGGDEAVIGAAGPRRLRGQRELSETGSLGQPIDDVEGLHRLSGRALDQVVDHGHGEQPAGPGVVVGEHSAMVAA